MRPHHIEIWLCDLETAKSIHGACLTFTKQSFCQDRSSNRGSRDEAGQTYLLMDNFLQAGMSTTLLQPS